MLSGDIFLKLKDEYIVWLEELEILKMEGQGREVEREMDKCIALLWWHLVCPRIHGTLVSIRVTYPAGMTALHPRCPVPVESV